MKLSLIVPTYKKEDIVLDQLERLYGYLSRKNPDFELIFVIDGYVDNIRISLSHILTKTDYRRLRFLVTLRIEVRVMPLDMA